MSNVILTAKVKKGLYKNKTLKKQQQQQHQPQQHHK